MESKDISCFSRKPCEVQRVAEDISEANKIGCCGFEARWRICNNKKLNKETAMIPEAHISVFQTEDTISDQMLNFSRSGITCEDKFNGAKVDELDTTTNTHCLFTEKYNGDDALLPIPSQNWSYFESFINENKEEFLDLCTINDFSTNLISEEDSDSFLFDDESILNSDVCSLKIRYESFQDNIKEKTNAHQDDAQLQFFPSTCCNGTKKEGKTPTKNSAAEEERREHDNPEHHSLCQLGSKKCLLSGVFMDDWKDAESSLDSVCLSSVLSEDQGNWKFLKKSADRYSNQTNYTLRAKRQIRYSDDYLYDIDSLETMKTLGKMDHVTDTPKEDDDDWCPRKRKKTGKKEPPVIIKYIIVNRFKGHKNMHVKISRLDCTERQVLLTDEVVKKYKKLSPLKEFWSPVPNCNVYHNQEKNDGKLKICSDAGMSYMFFASKNKKQQTLANGTASVKIGHTLNRQKDSVIETVDSNTKVPKKVQKYDKSVYEFTDEIELKRITIRTVSKGGWLRDMQQEDSFQKLKKQNILPKKRTNAQDGKGTSGRDNLENPDENPQVLNADVHKIQGQWNSASGSLGNFNTTSLHSSIAGNKIETSGELLSLDPPSSPDCPVASVYNIHSAPEIPGGYFRSLLDGDDSSVNENFQIPPQDSSTGQQFKEDVTENPFSSPRQRQINTSTRCRGGESNVVPLEVEPNIQEACNAETTQSVRRHRVMNKELFSSCEVDSENEKMKNQLNVNNSANQYGFKMYSCQNEINANFTQKVSEETKHLFTSKDTLCILDISNFTAGKAKPTLSSEFSKERTPEIPSKVVKSDVNSLQQCSQNHFPKKAPLLNECSEQFQIHSELYYTTIQTLCTKSEPTSVSFSPCAQSSNQLQTFDHVGSNNYKCSKVNKAINSFKKRHAKSNTKQWDRRAIQKYKNYNNEIKAIKIENIEKDSTSSENYKVEEYSSDILYANPKKQPDKACKPTKGFTNKDLEMCTKLMKKGLMSTKNKLSIKEEKLNTKAKYWIAPAESYENVPSNIPRGSRLLNSDQREFEEPGNILSNIVSGMAAVKQFMMASVQPILNQGEVVLPAVNQFMEVQNGSKWKPKPIQTLHIGTKDLKNKPLHVSECTPDNVGFDGYPVGHVANCCVQSVFASSTQIADCSCTSNALCE
ncbi:neurite extension and migration factor-like [Pristis pectinata]|uniref:neurite extension and migration factor-like n=1 Tax=Pristis pectinata TaxID=685728 RepID=UPI00223E74A5|nr:neurite extension and migration factor-like [Pristis pectinata]